jgi:hypothetical protein
MLYSNCMQLNEIFLIHKRAKCLSGYGKKYSKGGKKLNEIKIKFPINFLNLQNSTARRLVGF